MNLIKVVDRNIVLPFWEKCHEFRPSDPEPTIMNWSSVFVDLSCLVGYDQSRTFGFFCDDIIFGCGTVWEKTIDGLRIGGVCDIAVEPKVRRNGIGNNLMDVILTYMNNVGFDISILWASIPEMYRKHGYLELFNNMMYRPIRGLPNRWTIPKLIEIPKTIGTW
jgi:GNAT superfamily N-acetyltransferase